MHYRVYYDDDSEWDSDDCAGLPPAWGVQVIVQDHAAHGKAMVSGGDFYVRKAGRWYAADMAGLLSYVTRSATLERVLIGEMVSDERYNEIFHRANVEREKTGWTQYERRPD